MDIFSLGSQIKDIHNSTFGFNAEILVASFLIYKRVSKRVGSTFMKLVSAVEIQSNTLTDHSKKLDEHEVKIENHEKRIGVLETKPK